MSQQAPAWLAVAGVNTACPALTDAFPEQRNAAVFVGEATGSATTGVCAEAGKDGEGQTTNIKSAWARVAGIGRRWGHE